MRFLRGNRGTSVVEVLVVMVVLLVGILTAIRLFPPGFASVRHAENVTFAGRLAQYEIERWKDNAQNLPDGVLPIGEVSGNLAVLNDLFPGPPVDDANASSLRRIIGETTRIPFGGWSTGPQSGSLYVLSFSPVDVRYDSTGLLSNFAVRGGDLSRRIFDSANSSVRPWDWLRPHQYGIDYGQGSNLPKVAFRKSSQARTFYISCSWWESSGGNPELHTVTNLAIHVPPNTAEWIDVPITPSSSFLGFDNYSDTVSRGFMEVANWSSDPYEFRFIDSTLGIIEFNPLGYAQKEFGRPLEAKIDYDILDLGIIREDKRVPSSMPYRINLTLNHLKEKGVSQEINGDEYLGLRPGVLGDDVLAVDLQTARVIDLNGSKIDHKDGLVELPSMVTLLGDTPVQLSPAGRNIRFFYKAEGDWSVQFQKAYSQYEREYVDKELSYRSYFVGPAGGVGGSKRIWFAACNSNGVVSVEYDYADADGRIKKVVGESHRATDVLSPGPGGEDSTYIELKETPVRIYSVNGISIRARVVWRESERWRHVDLDSTLVRKPAS